MYGEPIWKSDRVDTVEPSVTTTAGEKFKYGEHCAMADLVYRRFGKSPEVATKAWSRMMQSTPSVEDFMRLVGDYDRIVKEMRIEQLSRAL